MRRIHATVVLAIAAIAVTFAESGVARAAEAPSVDDDDRPEAGDFEELGPRGNMRTRADTVSFDTREKMLELSGNVRLDAPPFHLRSQHIRLTRVRYGIEIEGKGQLQFCPCLGTPLRVDFEDALVAPPGDLILTKPTLRLYDVPVMYLPYFWLRSDEKIGALPPDLAYRGQDGVFVGEGLHLPWRAGGERQALDLRAGAYLVHGFAVDARLRTGSSTTRIRYDRLPGAPAPAIPLGPANADDGVLFDARGATTSAGGELTAAWDVDAIRGRRGLVATTDVGEAARPWDRAGAEAALRLGPLTVSQGMRAVARRGGGAPDLDAAGPITRVRASGAAASGVTYDATVEGGALRLAGNAVPFGTQAPDTLSFARGELGALAATSLGGVAGSLALRGAGDVGEETARGGVDRAAQARLHVGVPLARALGEDRLDPTIHTLEPFVEGAVLHAHGDGILGVLPGRGTSVIDGTAPLAEAGLTTALGRPSGRQAIDLTIAAGGAYGSEIAASKLRTLGRARAAATLGWLGLTADGAWLPGAPSGRAGIARARVGPADGIRLTANVAARGGLDPVLARALTDAPLEPEGGLLALEGTTGGAGFVVPWSRAITTAVSADADLTHEELVAARAGLELHDRCGCVTLHANGSHRIGRSGVDVWLALDFVADR